MKITKYQLVYDQSYPKEETLEDAVNRLIGEGWQPLGGISFDVSGDSRTTSDYDSSIGSMSVSSTAVQAMVKYKTPDQPTQ